MGKNNFLNRYTDTIFIMLGTSCNMSCRYCLQKCQDIPQLPTEINPDIYDFIQECCNNNITSQTQDPITLHFYGGEPVLYIDKIKEIVTKTKSLNVHYSMISNGKAIDAAIVEFLNQENFSVCISWDGYNTSNTRIYDVLKENQQNILNINDLALNAIISAETYPMDVCKAFQEIDDQYTEIHGYRLKTQWDYVFDTGITDKSLIKDIDYGRLYQDGQDIAKAYINFLIEHKENKKDALKESLDRVAIILASQFQSRMQDWYSTDDYKKEEIKFGACLNGIEVLNMDLSGNLYSCHNIFKPIASIHTPLWLYLKEIYKSDKCKDIKKQCNACPAISCCMGGCKLINYDSEEKKMNCKIKQSFFGGLMDEFIKNGVIHFGC